MELSTLNTTLGFNEDNEPGKLPLYTLTADGKPYTRVQVTVTIDGQDASDKTYDELREAIEQSPDVVIEGTKILPLPNND